MPHTERPKIAHLEDNEGDNILLRKTLKDMADIQHFYSFQEMQNAPKDFDLIITDLGLPDVYGTETLIALRDKFGQIPILALTGLGGAFITGDEVRAMMDAGADNVVSKDLIRDRRMITLIKQLLNE